MREEQNRMLGERVESLKQQSDLERRDFQVRLESVSKALDQSQRELADKESTNAQLVRRYAVIDDKVGDYETEIEKLQTELELERTELRKTLEKDNEIQNRFQLHSKYSKKIEVILQFLLSVLFVKFNIWC